MNILITGTTSGIGHKLAQDYLREGHTVYCCGRNVAVLSKLTASFGERATSLHFDVADLNDCKQALAAVSDLDLVILNAGTCEYIDAKNFDAQSFERVIRINLIGIANCLEALIPRLRVGSTLSLMGSSSSYLPLPRAEAYGASKAATEYLAKTLAITLKNQGIHVSYIAPGFVETPLTDLNDFPMPMRVDVEYASRHIRKGIAKGKNEIHFPRLFTGMLKSLSLLPFAIQRLLLAKMTTQQ
jgi:NAD(P)-dependent dehydrogenase (short-subunit alcohol dehydrogenase family)